MTVSRGENVQEIKNSSLINEKCPFRNNEVLNEDTTLESGIQPFYTIIIEASSTLQRITFEGFVL